MRSYRQINDREEIVFMAGSDGYTMLIRNRMKRFLIVPFASTTRTSFNIRSFLLFLDDAVKIFPKILSKIEK
jgi:hypothetical protein